ncbi:MAG: SseB family protein [Lachnospiraceae bacterium]|nr:SseB family protein [Lachnospiraceae bacterium]
MTDKGLKGNEKIEEGIKSLKDSFTDESLAAVLTVIRKRTLENGQFVVAVDTGTSDTNLSLKTVDFNGKKWFVAFTSFDEEMKGKANVMSGFLADIAALFDMALKSPEVEGVILNPYGNMMSLNKQIIEVIKG